MKNVFYVDSVHHTGTRFLIAFLNAHPDVAGNVYAVDLIGKNDSAAHLPDLPKENGFKKGEPYFVHTHLDIKGENAEEQLEKNGFDLKARKVLVPVRDPGAALISRETYVPKGGHEFIVHGFCTLAGLEKDKRYFFMPIDLEMSEANRLELLEAALEHVGLPSKPYVKKWAKEWPAIGACPNSRIKRMYHSGQAKHALFSVARERNLLKAQEPVIRPFLERLGYTGSNALPWYSPAPKKETKAKGKAKKNS